MSEQELKAKIATKLCISIDEVTPRQIELAKSQPPQRFNSAQGLADFEFDKAAAKYNYDPSVYDYD